MSEYDLGHGHRMRYARWAPDRALNPDRAHLPDVERYCAIIDHPRPDGAGECSGSITFAGPVQREIDPDRPTWDVVSWDPPTFTPSVLCRCGDHGFITGGRWVPA